MSDSSDGDWIGGPGGDSSSSEEETAPPVSATGTPPVPEGGPLLEEMENVAALVEKLEALDCTIQRSLIGLSESPGI
ncbi:hypothetical protein ON010_g18774 [Phytophthora cinnamomi]|nr:hypothetical protein ON010_g18774 [Phytophthora cinnamomi]